MINDKCFCHKKDADNYIDKQPGVMGRREKQSQKEYGDWMVEEIEVIEGPYGPEEQKKEMIASAKKKLSPAELKALGL